MRNISETFNDQEAKRQLLVQWRKIHFLLSNWFSLHKRPAALIKSMMYFSSTFMNQALCEIVVP